MEEQQEVLRKLRLRPDPMVWQRMVVDFEQAVAEVEEAEKKRNEAVVQADKWKAASSSPGEERLGLLAAELQSAKTFAQEQEKARGQAEGSMREAVHKYVAMKRRYTAAAAELGDLTKETASLNDALQALSSELQSEKRKNWALEEKLSAMASPHASSVEAAGSRAEDLALLETYNAQLQRIAEEFNRSTVDLMSLRAENERLLREIAKLKSSSARRGSMEPADDDISALAILGADDVLPEECIRSIDVAGGGRVAAAQFDMSGRNLLLGTTGGLVVYDSQSFSPIKLFRVGESTVSAVDVSPSGGEWVVAGTTGADPHIDVWRFDTERHVATLRSSLESVTAVMFSLDSRQVVAASRRRIPRWDVGRAAEIGVIEAPSSVLDMCFSARNVVATAHHDRMVRLYDLRDRKMVLHKACHSNVVTGVSLTPDTMSLLTTSKDHTLMLLDIRMGLNPRKVYRSSEYFCHVSSRGCMSSGSSYVAAGSSTGKIILWDALSGKVIKTLSKRERAQPVGCYWSPTVPKLIVRYNDAAFYDVFGPHSSF